MSKPKKPELSDEEKSLFRNAVRGVKPLAHTKVPPPKTAPRAFKKRRAEPENENVAIGFQFSDYETLPPVNHDELLQFIRSGVSPKILRKMRLGQYNVNAILDMHGKTVEQAREALSQFLLHCQEDGIQQVLIIHGKGRNAVHPILKNKLNHWLRQTAQVLAFCSATPHNGSSGALYVLLRKSP